MHRFLEVHMFLNPQWRAMQERVPIDGGLGMKIGTSPLRGKIKLAEGEDQPKVEDSPPPREVKDPRDLVGAQEEGDMVGRHLDIRDPHFLALGRQFPYPLLKRRSRHSLRRLCYHP